MAVWIKLNDGFSVEQLQLNESLQIVRFDYELNSFRFGFASMNEQELQSAVNAIEKMIVKV